MNQKDIYIAGDRMAVLSHGVESENYLTLQEAVIAFYQLPQERREIATITSVGVSYSASEIECFHYSKNSS